MKILNDLLADIRQMNAVEQQARSEAYDSHPGFHWAMLGLAFGLCIAAVFITIWFVRLPIGTDPVMELVEALASIPLRWAYSMAVIGGGIGYVWPLFVVGRGQALGWKRFLVVALATLVSAAGAVSVARQVIF